MDGHGRGCGGGELSRHQKKPVLARGARVARVEAKLSLLGARNFDDDALDGFDFAVLVNASATPVSAQQASASVTVSVPGPAL